MFFKKQLFLFRFRKSKKLLLFWSQKNHLLFQKNYLFFIKNLSCQKFRKNHLLFMKNPSYQKRSYYKEIKELLYFDYIIHQIEY